MDNIILIILLTFWFSTIPVSALTLIRFLRNRKVFVEKDLKRVYNDPKIIFQITTRSATQTKVVQRGINSITQSANTIDFDNYLISIVTDDENDIYTIKDQKCEVVVVTKDFATYAVKKGRALQYAVEHRRKKNQNTSKFWIFHMDDESFVTEQTILSLLKYIRNGKGIAAEGPIFYPLKFEKANPITAIAESIRPFSCYDCVSQMTNPPPIHMHGSNLLVRSDVEDKVEWKFGPTLAEDQLFGYKIYEKYGSHSLGWHGGVLLEQPPLGFKDHFMQRRRWIIGTLQNISNFPFWQKFKILFKLSSYFMGFVSGVFSIILYFQSITPKLLTIFSSIDITNIDSYNLLQNIFSTILPSISLDSISNVSNQVVVTGPTNLGIISIFLIFPYAMWIISYQIGLFFNIRHKKYNYMKKTSLHLQTLILSTILGLVETFPAFITIIEYFIKSKFKKFDGIPTYDFYVINK